MSLISSSISTIAILTENVIDNNNVVFAKKRSSGNDGDDSKGSDNTGDGGGGGSSSNGNGGGSDNTNAGGGSDIGGTSTPAPSPEETVAAPPATEGATTSPPPPAATQQTTCLDGSAPDVTGNCPTPASLTQEPGQPSSTQQTTCLDGSPPDPTTGSCPTTARSSTEQNISPPAPTKQTTCPDGSTPDITGNCPSSSTPAPTKQGTAPSPSLTQQTTCPDGTAPDITGNCPPPAPTPESTTTPSPIGGTCPKRTWLKGVDQCASFSECKKVDSGAFQGAYQCPGSSALIAPPELICEDGTLKSRDGGCQDEQESPQQLAAPPPMISPLQQQQLARNTKSCDPSTQSCAPVEIPSNTAMQPPSPTVQQTSCPGGSKPIYDKCPTSSTESSKEPSSLCPVNRPVDDNGKCPTLQINKPLPSQPPFVTLGQQEPPTKSQIDNPTGTLPTGGNSQATAVPIPCVNNIKSCGPMSITNGPDPNPDIPSLNRFQNSLGRVLQAAAGFAQCVAAVACAAEAPPLAVALGARGLDNLVAAMTGSNTLVNKCVKKIAEKAGASPTVQETCGIIADTGADFGLSLKLLAKGGPTAVASEASEGPALPPSSFPPPGQKLLPPGSPEPAALPPSSFPPPGQKLLTGPPPQEPVPALTYLRKGDLKGTYDPHNLGLDPKRGYQPHENDVANVIKDEFGGFVRSPHEGAEWIGKSGKYQGKSFDAIGFETPAIADYNKDMTKFLNQIDKHLNKSLDYLVVDTRHMSTAQQNAVLDKITSLPSGKMNRVVIVTPKGEVMKP